MNKATKIFITVISQLLVGAIPVLAGHFIEPLYMSPLLSEAFSKRAASFSLADLRFGLSIAFMASVFWASVATFFWLWHSNSTVIRHPKEVPTISLGWVFITLAGSALYTANFYFINEEFLYVLRSELAIYIWGIGMMTFFSFHFIATSFATRRTLQPSIPFRNMLFARS